MSASVVLRSTFLNRFLWCCVVVSVVLLALSVAAGPGPDPGPIDYIGTAVFGVVTTLAFLRGTRARIELDNGGLTFFNYVLTYRIPWGELRDVSVGYGGLKLTRTDGSVVSAASVGKSNWSTWANRSSAADDRVDLIRREMAIRASGA